MSRVGKKAINISTLKTVAVWPLGKEYFSWRLTPSTKYQLPLSTKSLKIEVGLNKSEKIYLFKNWATAVVKSKETKTIKPSLFLIKKTTKTIIKAVTPSPI